ncbi:MAG: DUF3048 domain-containing protein [Clostridia bacterium]|nr:DUF3048 domain-containing protein [Clostridia bacterium]
MTIMSSLRWKAAAVALLVLVITASIIFTGCSAPGKGKTGGQDGTNTPQENQAGQDQNGQAGTQEPVLKEPALNPLTGITVEKVNLEQRPLAVMVENSPPARPQSGLDKADIVYEVLAEGGITRFMAIFYGGDTGEVGPVRSARPYFLARALEYDALYVHSGGSPEALAQIKELRIADLDQFGNNYPFWRSRDRKAPHNLYGDTRKMRKVAQKKRPDWKAGVPAFAFLEKGQENPDGLPVNSLTINYANKASQVKYEYNPSDQQYYRSNGGKAHKDAVTGNRLTATNIIVQFTGTKVIDGEGRRKVSMVGTGKGFLFTGGQRYQIEWAKDNLRSATRYKFAGGKEMFLNPGRTWIQVVPKGTEITN